MDSGGDGWGGGVRAAWDGTTLVVHAARLPGTLAVVPVGALRLGAELVPSAGVWAHGEGVVRFTPAFPLAPASVHAVVGRTDAHEHWHELARFRVPGAAVASRTVVESLEPGASVVPANLLRFVVGFSAPMEEGSAAGRIHVYDDGGAELPGALLEMPPELWDRDRRRLTVLLEPGRIKRGLQPNQLAGAPLRAGEAVTLVVEAGIRDSAGAPLAVGASRTFRVGAAVRTRVDPQLWRVLRPQTPGDPVVVHFDRPLDRALVRRCLRVIERQSGDGASRVVNGRAALSPDASTWTFTAAVAPTDPWFLEIDPSLEDLAGNSVRRVFDRDLERDLTEVGDTLSSGADRPRLHLGP